jgi:hypothetical protein
MRLLPDHQSSIDLDQRVPGRLRQLYGLVGDRNR